MIQNFQGHTPDLHPTARAADSAALVGSVTLEDRVSVWYNAVLRGDECTIRVGRGSNIQDAAILHGDPAFPVTVGRDVTVGHAAILHGCTVEDGCLIGMGAILLNGCVIGAGSLVAAGALVTQNTVIPSGSLVMGAPAKAIRPLRPDEAAKLTESAQTYHALSAGQLPLCGGPTAGGVP